MTDEDDINHILNEQDLYEILGVPKNVLEEELRRRYKQLALTYHPDKCDDPRAEEAFKAVGKAFATLSDPQKRQQYDNQSCRRQTTDKKSSNDDSDAFANMFQGTSGGRRRSQGRPRPARPTPVPKQFWGLLRVLPLVVVTLCYSVLTASRQAYLPAFSLYPDPEHGFAVKRDTEAHQIPYYVQASFPAGGVAGSPQLQIVEDLVLATYRAHLHQRCDVEQHDRSRHAKAMQQRAAMYRSYKDAEAPSTFLDRIEALQTPSCDKLELLLSPLDR